MTFAAGLADTMNQVVQWRRHLHKYPELSYKERETSAFVARHLREWGWNVRTDVGGHGIIADLEGAAPGKKIALRADMDALPIQDEKDAEYASQVPGVMHACGHDGHTSTLMGVAKLLAESKDRLQGSVRLLFQPAEEVTPGGAIAMMKDGALEGVDAIYGVHLWTPFPAGTVYTAEGPLMAAADEFTIHIKGKGGHGGLPHQAVDSVLIASHFVVNVQSVVSRNVDPTLPCVVSVGAIRGGTTFNVIASECKLQGTVRTFDKELRLYAKARVEEVLETTCRMFGADYRLNYLLGYPPVVNDAASAEFALRRAGELFGAERVGKPPLIMAGEDFAYYLERVPGCFIFVGAGSEKMSAPHHHPLFDIEESALETSLRLLYSLAADR
jgi:amidohydrolase